MFDTIAAHIEFIQRNDIFREVITNAVIGPKFTFDCLFGGKEVGNLNVQLLVSFMADEINFFTACFADCDFIAAAQQFKINNVF